MATKDKGKWLIIIFVLSGLVIGGLLGEIAQNVEFLKWLSYGQTFGFNDPFVLNLNVITLTFALSLKINIASIVGLAIALFIYRKI